MNTDKLLSLHPGGTELTVEAALRTGLNAGDKVLDIGCGTGASLAALSGRFGIKAYGIDISEQILSIARSSNPAFELSVADAHDLPYSDGFFDAVMIECVITLLDSLKSALEEAARVLRSGGRLVISTLADSKDRPVFETEVICENGLANVSALTHFLGSLGFKLLCSEDCRRELTDYMIESIMEYGSISDRIAAETALTGASVLDCSCICTFNPREVTYYSMIFVKM